MKTKTITSAAKNEEITLGWSSMPAYGEVMNTAVGTSHTDVVSTLKTEKKTIIASFWSTLSSLK
jgi:hypothetical protein